MRSLLILTLAALPVSFAVADPVAISNAPDATSAIQAYSHDAGNVQSEAAFVAKMVHLGQPQLAEAQAVDLTQKDPNNALAWAVVANMQARTGHLTDALRSITGAVDRNPEDTYVQSVAGALLKAHDQETNGTYFPADVEQLVTHVRQKVGNKQAFADAYHASPAAAAQQPQEQVGQQPTQQYSQSPTYAPSQSQSMTAEVPTYEGRTYLPDQTPPTYEYATPSYDYPPTSYYYSPYYNSYPYYYPYDNYYYPYGFFGGSVIIGGHFHDFDHHHDFDHFHDFHGHDFHGHDFHGHDFHGGFEHGGFEHGGFEHGGFEHGGFEHGGMHGGDFHGHH